MAVLKVLECPGYVPFMEDELPEIEPVFYRDGFYLRRTIWAGVVDCWAEYQGKAYRIESSFFIMELKELDHKPLRQSERQAILALRGLRNDLVAPLLEHLAFDDFCRELRQISLTSKWQARKFFIQFKTRVQRLDSERAE